MWLMHPVAFLEEKKKKNELELAVLAETKHLGHMLGHLLSIIQVVEDLQY